jgi:plasmid maintenance system antidote protein VapI
MKKEIKIPHINIGTIIKAKAAEKSISGTQLAAMIQCHYSTVNDIYQRKSINTEQLLKISLALEYDFFTEIFGNSLKNVITKSQDDTNVTVQFSSEKIIIEKDNGIKRITEYRKFSEK